MRLSLTFLVCGLAISGMAEEGVNYRFDLLGEHKQEGFSGHTPEILAVAEKPITFHFSGLSADWQPVVRIHRVTSARRVELPSVRAEFSKNIWRITWTPPKTHGPAKYEIRLDGEPKRIVRIETRDPKWLTATREALVSADWKAQGLTAEERAALAILDIRTQSNQATTATLEMQPRKGYASRRRVLWDEKNPNLLVWHPGPAAGDLELRAPRWWLSPEALATDHGLIRFLDLFSEPPLNP